MPISQSPKQPASPPRRDPSPSPQTADDCERCAQITSPPDVANLSWQDATAPQRHELILQTALTLLREAGPDAVTMRGIAQRLGVGAMTLYTYVDSADNLHQLMIRRGFETLHQTCCSAGQANPNAANHWRGGAEAYLQFAQAHPNLYRLMFESPLPESDHDLLEAGFSGLLMHVTQRLAQTGVQEPDLARQARTEAGRYWLCLHGLAMAIIADRTSLLHGSIDDVLTNLLDHAAPRC
ncbi:MAG: TetR/AcrR family transcriptional regulator [Planctomycetota bacterium]